MIYHLKAIFHLALKEIFGVITKGKSDSLQWRGGVVIDSLESVKSWIKHINPQLSGTLHSAQT